jgi:transcriptional regulator with XRE-family HTH domain
LKSRCGIDQPALSRLENGHTPNPTLDTLWRHAAVLGKRLGLAAEDESRSWGQRARGGRATVKGMAGREKATL